MSPFIERARARDCCGCGLAVAFFFFGLLLPGALVVVGPPGPEALGDGFFLCRRISVVDFGVGFGVSFSTGFGVSVQIGI